MYRFALAMTPDQVEAVAAQLHVERRQRLFARRRVPLPASRPRRPRYVNIAEMAERIASAAQDTGIGPALLLVLHAHSGFGGLAPNDGQRRSSTISIPSRDFLRQAAGAVADLHGAVVGVAP